MRIFLIFFIIAISFLNGITISGFVESNGRPLKNVKVSLFTDGYEQSVLNTQTDILGYFSMDYPKRYEASYYLSLDYFGSQTLVAPRKPTRFSSELSFGKVTLYLPEHYHIAREKKPKLFEPKGEFENTKMYISRKKDKELYLEKVRVEQESKIAIKNRKVEIEKKRIIEDSLEKVNVVLEKIGRYDADKEKFSSILVGFSKQKNTIFHKVKVTKMTGMLDLGGNNFTASKAEVVKDENKNFLGILEIGKTYPATKNNKILSAFYEIYYTPEFTEEAASKK